MASIVANISTERPCAYFFCTFKEPESLKAVNILLSIVCHFLDGLGAADDIWSTIAEKYGTCLPDVSSPHIILDLILPFLPRNQKYIVILDGLEDLSDEEAKDTFESLQRLMQERTMLLCHSARSESRYQRVAHEKLGTGSSINLDTEEHDEEMRAFIENEIAKRNESCHLSPELEDLVVKQLVAGSQGMSVCNITLNSVSEKQIADE